MNEIVESQQNEAKLKPTNGSRFFRSILLKLSTVWDMEMGLGIPVDPDEQTIKAMWEFESFNFLQLKKNN